MVKSPSIVRLVLSRTGYEHLNERPREVLHETKSTSNRLLIAEKKYGDSDGRTRKCRKQDWSRARKNHSQRAFSRSSVKYLNLTAEKPSTY